MSFSGISFKTIVCIATVIKKGFVDAPCPSNIQEFVIMASNNLNDTLRLASIW